MLVEAEVKKIKGQAVKGDACVCVCVCDAEDTHATR